MSKFSIEYLKSNVRDFARPNLFKVRFNFKRSSEFVEMTAKSINLPAYDVGKLEIKRMGQKVILPSIMNTGECQATFWCDDQYNQRNYLYDNFKNAIYNYETNKYVNIEQLSTYYMDIEQLNNKFESVFKIRLHHCYPTSIGEIQFSHDSENQVTEFPATFAYSTYDVL